MDASGGESPKDIEALRAAAADELARRGATALTLEEYAERAAALERATDAAEIEATLADLPEADERPEVRRPRWLVAVFGGTDHRGRWRLGSRLRIVAVLGGASLDLGQAQPEAPESRITAIAVLGGVKILAPPGVPIEFTGFALFGGRSDERPPGPRIRGSPVVRIRALCLFGGVAVKARE